MSVLGRRRVAAAALAAALTLAVSACGSDSGDGGGTSKSGKTDVTLGVIPIIDIAPIKLGVKKGFFDEQNLNVKLQESQGGAAIVPAVVSGDYQFGYSNIVSLLLARDKGVPVKMISVGARASNDPLNDGSGQLMARDSSVKEVSDLAGKKIAVNTLKGINEVAVRTSLEKAGVSGDDVSLVEVPIPNMPAALKSGDVDAAMLGEPFITVAKQQGAHPVAVSYAAMGKGLPFAGWFASEKYAKSNPDVVKRFSAALQKSLTYAQDHPDEARATLDTYLKLDKGVSTKVTLPGWNPVTDRAEIENLAQLTVDAGLIGDTKPLDSLLEG